MRAPVLLHAVVLLLAGVLVACGSERPGTPPQHAILVTVEGLRADRLSCWNHDRPTSARLPGARPEQAFAIDQLAEAGVRFVSAYPAPDGTTAPHAATCPGGTAGWAARIDGVQMVAFRTGAPGDGPGPRPEAGIPVTVADDDLATITEAIRWIAAQDWETDARRLVWVHLDGPQYPWTPGTFELPTTKDTVDFEAWFTDPDYVGAADGSEAYREAVASGEVTLTASDVAHLLGLYEGEVARVNALVFALLDTYRYYTRAVDGGARTAVALAGVRPLVLPGEGDAWGTDRAEADPAWNVPLLLHHPASLTGRRVFSTPASTQDLGPTLTAWLGGDADQPRSLLNHVDERPLGPFVEAPVVATTHDGRRTVGDGRFRWTEEAGGSGRLIDIARDPQGTVDRSTESPDVAARLAGARAGTGAEGGARRAE